MENSPWLCRDQRRGALGSCVHPHRPWSKSHPLSDGGDVATAVGRDGRWEKSEAISDTGVFAAALHNHIHRRLSSRVLPPPNGAINPAFHFFCFHVSPVVVTGTVVVSVLGGSVGVTVSAGVLVSAHQNKKTAGGRGGVKGGGVRQSSNCSNCKEQRQSLPCLFWRLC